MSPARVTRRRAGSRSTQARRRHGWLELVQTSGPFLTLPVIDRVLPDGPPVVPRARPADLRALVAEMLAHPGTHREQVIEGMLAEVLGWGEHLRMYHRIPDNLGSSLSRTTPRADTAKLRLLYGCGSRRGRRGR